MGYSHDCQHRRNLQPHNGILSYLNGRKSRYPQWNTLMLAFKKSSYPWWDTLMFALKWSLYPRWDILSCLNQRNLCTHDGILSCLHWRNLCTHKWFDPIHGNPHKNQVKAKKTRPTIRTKGKKNNTEWTEEKRREWHPIIIYDEMAGVLGLRNDKPITAFIIQKRKQNGLQVFKRLLNCMYQVRIPTYPLPKFRLCS